MRRSAKWVVGFFLCCGLVVGWFVLTPSPPTIVITAEEFRFVPSRVELEAFEKVRIVIRNQGRETHMFQGAFFNNRAVDLDWESKGSPMKSRSSVKLSPGESVSIIATFSSGVYSYRCLIQGHRGMEGLILVQTENVVG